MSIRLRLTLWYTTLFALVLVVFAVIVYVAVSRQWRSRLEYSVHLQATTVAQNIHTLPLTPSTSQPGRWQLPATTLTDQRFYVQIVNPSGQVLATSDNVAQPLPPFPTGLASALRGEEAHTPLTLGNGQIDVYSAPLLVDDALIGVLQVAVPMQPLQASLVQLRLILGVVVLSATLLATAIGWWLATKAMHPVAQMTRTASAIGHSANLTQRLPTLPQHDELGQLAATFNDMLAQLEQAFATQRRFLADASHELRTPLTTIRMNVESLLRSTEADKSPHDETLRTTTREIDRMHRLVADLLALARADAGQPLVCQPLALDTLMLEVYHQAKPLAQDVRLRLDTFDQIVVEGDADRLKQLLLNLVSNALRYTPAGGTVTLALSQCDGWAKLQVQDTGVGIPGEHLPHIFERFYRVEQPRTRHAGGTGLGLAICQWIAEAHGGRIDVASQQGVGSTFTVWLPACQ